MKIALIGSHPMHRMLAPFADESWKCWVCSADNRDVPHVDVWFEIHGDMMWPGAAPWEERYIHWLNHRKFPVYVQRTDLVPNGIQFPAKELLAEFGPYWFTSSIAWMFAFALKQEDISEIALYGVDMATKDEYINQRPAMHYWMDMASRKGVRVYIPPESDLLQPPPLYGYSECTDMGRKIRSRKAELQQKIDALKKEQIKVDMRISVLEGGLDDTEYYQQIWTGGIPDDLKLEKL